MTKKTETADVVDTAPETETPAPVVEKPAKPAPKPKPGDEDYDWSAEYDGGPVYLHTFPDGTVVGLKPFGTIYSKTWLYKVRNATSDVDLEFSALDRGSCPAARRVLEGLDDTEGDPLSDLFSAWAKAGTEGLTSGE
jgi:hypothetical protein